jgi:protein-ribulosamine 3-kinase
MPQWNIITAHIHRASGVPFQLRHERAISGGCINRAHRISDGQRTFFVKLNGAARLAMFEAEAAGLRELATAQALRVPQPLCVGVADALAYLVLEWLELSGHVNGAQVGQQLAQLHRASAAQFGWQRDNTIGATPQLNPQTLDWVTFWGEQRLGYQLQLAAANGYGGQLQRSGEQLRLALPTLLDHQPQPSLLHGDLWGGNLGALADGAPVIFDPAVYYGDRETDVAMTELFGGFDPAFYAAYREAWALAAGYDTRKILYNLYHVLNHLNLFGGGYLRQAERMMAQLLAETR